MHQIFFFLSPSCFLRLLRSAHAQNGPQASYDNWTASALSNTWAWSNDSQQKSDPDSLHPQITATEQYQAMAAEMH